MTTSATATAAVKLTSIDTTLIAIRASGSLGGGGGSLNVTTGSGAMTGSLPVTIAVDDTVMTGRFPAPATIPTAGGTVPSATTIGVVSRILNVSGSGLDIWQGGQTAATTGSFVGYGNVLPYGKYLLSAPTLTDTQGIVLQMDANGYLRTTLSTKIAGEDIANDVILVNEKPRADITNSWSSYASTILTGSTGVIVKSTPGRLRMMRATNSSTVVAYWLLAVNKATAPVANDLPVWAVEVPVIGALGGPTTVGSLMDLGGTGFYFSAGISYALSTTSQKVTFSTGTADCMVYAQYI